MSQSVRMHYDSYGYGFCYGKSALRQLKGALSNWVDDEYFEIIKSFLKGLNLSHLDFKKTAAGQEKGEVIQDEIKARFPEIFNLDANPNPNTAQSSGPETVFIQKKLLFIALRVVYRYHKSCRWHYLKKLKMGGRASSEVRSRHGVSGIKNNGASGVQVGLRRKRVRSAKTKAIVEIRKYSVVRRHQPSPAARASSSTSDDEFVDSEHDTTSMDEDGDDVDEDSDDEDVEVDVETGDMQVDQEAGPSRGFPSGIVDTHKIGPPIRRRLKACPRTEQAKTQRQPTLSQLGLVTQKKGAPGSAFESADSPFFGYSSRPSLHGSLSGGSASVESRVESSGAQGPRRNTSFAKDEQSASTSSSRRPESDFPGWSQPSTLNTPATNTAATATSSLVPPIGPLSNKAANANLDRSSSSKAPASLVPHRYRRGYSCDRFRKSVEAQSQSQSQGKNYHDGRSDKENCVLSIEMPPSNQLVLQEQQYRRRLGQDVAPSGSAQVAQRLPPPIPLSSHPLRASCHHPPDLSASASPIHRATPGVNAALTPIHTFLASCIPSMAHLAPLFIRFGCDTEELVLGVGMWDRERIKVFLEDVQQSNADNMNGEGGSSWREGSVEVERTRGMTRMEMTIIRNHWETYFK